MNNNMNTYLYFYCRNNESTLLEIFLQLLSQFISPHTGRVYGRHITGERSMGLNIHFNILINVSHLGHRNSLAHRLVRSKAEGGIESNKESSFNG